MVPSSGVLHLADDPGFSGDLTGHRAARMLAQQQRMPDARFSRRFGFMNSSNIAADQRCGRLMARNAASSCSATSARKSWGNCSHHRHGSHLQLQRQRNGPPLATLQIA